jgi:hypothetical protein
MPHELLRAIQWRADQGLERTTSHDRIQICVISNRSHISGNTRIEFDELQQIVARIRAKQAKATQALNFVQGFEWRRERFSIHFQ